MSDSWQCPHCGAINPKPDYVIRLARLKQSLGTLSVGSSSEPLPRCSKCDFAADVNAMLVGEYDYPGESAPDQVAKVEERGTASKTPSAPARSERLTLATVGGLVVGVLCLGAVLAAGVSAYLRRAKVEETLRPQSTSRSATSPSSTATVTPALTVRILGRTEAQRLFEEQRVPFLARKAIEQYSAEELNQVGKTITYTIYLDNSEPLAWGMGWCTTTEAILAQNFDHIQYTFILNGKDIPIEQFVEVEYYSEEMQGFCRLYYTILTDWMPGEHSVETIVTYDQSINDGWDDYPAGTITYEYRIVVIH